MPEILIVIARLLVVYSIMSVTGIAGLLIRVLSLGSLTNVVRRAIVGRSSRLILWLIGVRLVLPERQALVRRNVMYTFNHNSLLDVLIITALGLDHTRCFLSEKTLKFVPVTISALAIGTLYIPQKKYPKRRRRFFERTTARIVRERFSVLVSSEGVHEFVHGVAPFNHGVYRMALRAGLSIVPLYLHIPRHVNSLEGFRFRGGSVRVEVLPTIDTSAWNEADLAEHVASVRTIFISRFNEAHGNESK